MWIHPPPSARAGHIISSPFTWWKMHTFFHLFFWFDNLNVAPAALNIGSLELETSRGIWQRHFFVSNSTKVTSIIWNFTVYLDSFRLSFIAPVPASTRQTHSAIHLLHRNAGEWWWEGRWVPSLLNVAVWAFYWIFTHLFPNISSYLAVTTLP